MTTQVMATADVNQRILDAAQDVWESWYDGGRIDDWNEFLTRIEYQADVDFGPTDNTPAIRRIRRHIRDLRRMG